MISLNVRSYQWQLDAQTGALETLQLILLNSQVRSHKNCQAMLALTVAARKAGEAAWAP